MRVLPFLKIIKIDLAFAARRVINGDAMKTTLKHNQPATAKKSDNEMEPFAKCQRCRNREADLTTAAGEKVCSNCATESEVANGNAA
jgi:hypothetical protein